MMKAYGNKKTVSSRMARKRLRRDVFVWNKTSKKRLLSQARRERKQFESEQQEA